MDLELVGNHAGRESHTSDRDSHHVDGHGQSGPPPPTFLLLLPLIILLLLLLLLPRSASNPIPASDSVLGGCGACRLGADDDHHPSNKNSLVAYFLDACVALVAVWIIGQNTGKKTFPTGSGG